MSTDLPLAGILVIDASRMLPGAVLARMLVDLGARVIKVEDPAGGDPFRHMPPLVGDMSTGFAAFLRGVESVCLDLRTSGHADLFVRLTTRADVAIDSFRPGRMAAWGIGPDRLRSLNPALVTCSLTSFGSEPPLAGHVAHDLNVMAASGLLAELSGHGLESTADTPNRSMIPRTQIADISTGMLACSAILAALLMRLRTGRGTHIDQPLSAGPLPFLTWSWADASAGARGFRDVVLGGVCPAYRIYRCGDGRRVALGALEPKFWEAFVAELGLSGLAPDGLDTGERGLAAGRIVEAKLLEATSGYWLELAERKSLPLTAVNHPAEGPADAHYIDQTERTATAKDALLTTGPYLRSFAADRPLRPAPVLGADTERVLRELGQE